MIYINKRYLQCKTLLEYITKLLKKEYENS